MQRPAQRGGHRRWRPYERAPKRSGGAQRKRCSAPLSGAATEGGDPMSIFVDEHTKVVVQGLTGSQGRFHALRNRAYGTQVVAGVTPGKGGLDVDGIPVFDTVADAVQETGANAAMVFVPARFAADAIYEAVDAGIPTVACIAEGLPAHDM